MTTPNEPQPNSNGNTKPGSVDPKVNLIKKAEDIADVVERDRRRRRRTARIMMSFIILTLALAGAVLVFGRSDQKVMRDTVTHQVGITVDRQAPGLIVREIEKQLPLTIDNEVSPIIAQTVENQIETEVFPELKNLAEQIASIETEGGSPVVLPFTTKEVASIKTTISQFPGKTEELAKLSDQVKVLTEGFAGIDGPALKKERLAINKRFATLENVITEKAREFDRISQKLAELEQLSLKLSAALKKLDPQSIDPCLQESQLEARVFRTYSVKENTTSPIYDLDFKIEVKDRKDRVVRGLIVRRRDAVLLREQDVTMGVTVFFSDNNFNYSLTPVFVNKRVLANDFIGLAISKYRKCTPPK